MYLNENEIIDKTKKKLKEYYNDIIYVCGVSNKKDTPPLSSTTITGKIIDEITKGYDIQKINYFDAILEKPPTNTQIKNEMKHFFNRIANAKKVLLFSEKIGKHFIKIDNIFVFKDPSYIFQYRKDELQEYIRNARKVLEN